MRRAQMVVGGKKERTVSGRVSFRARPAGENLFSELRHRAKDGRPGFRGRTVGVAPKVCRPT